MKPYTLAVCICLVAVSLGQAREMSRDELIRADILQRANAGYPPRPDALRRLRLHEPRWTAWWEANRAPYLKVMNQGRNQGQEQQPDPEVAKKYRGAAIEALTALKSDSMAMRASAALALGEIGDEATLNPLMELASKDKELKVRQAAILAVALLDNPKAEQFLAGIAFRSLPRIENMFADKPDDRQAALIALGLMSRSGPETIVKLQKMAGRPLVMARRLDDVPGRLRIVYDKTPDVYSFTMLPLSAWALTRPVDPAKSSTPKEFSADMNDAEAFADSSNLAASAISCWSLKWHGEPANAGVFQEALSKTNVPWIANAAMLSLGGCGGQQVVAGLSELLLASPTGKALPAYKMLDEQNDRLVTLWKVRQSDDVRRDVKDVQQIGYYDTRRKGRQAYGEAAAAVLEQSCGTAPEYNGSRFGLFYRRYMQLHFGGDACDPVRLQRYGRPVKGIMYEFSWLESTPTGFWGEPAWNFHLGMEPIFMAQLRGAAAIALGQIDTPASRAALRKVLAEKDDDYSDNYKSMAIMSLGQLGDVEALPALCELVHPTAPHEVVLPERKIRSPLRGFAALALGLYTRPVTTPQGLQDRKDFDKVSQLLGDRVADTKEQQDVRAACALALGLTGRTENLKYLQPASKNVGPHDDLLIGYVILARGMLGDRTILEPAKTFLAAGNNKTDMPGILARRAAVLGLGLTGSQEVLAVLSKCWGLSDPVDHETALAMSFCQGFNATDRLVTAMKDSAKPEAKASAARCLGELFMKERPSRLARLTNGSNYAMRIPRLTYYQQLANEFPYSYLLAPAADEWETLTPIDTPLPALPATSRPAHARTPSSSTANKK